MTSWFMLGAQAILAGASLHLLWWRVLPGVVRAKQPQLIVDVWLPVAIVLPFVARALGVGPDVRGDGWLPLAGPIVCAMFGAAFALIAAHGRFDAFGERTLLHEDEVTGVLWSVRARAIGVGLLAGVVLLMLGAAHVMTIWIGQAALALAAILLWINTPDDSPNARRTDHDAVVVVGVIFIVLLSFGHAALSYVASVEHRALSSAIVLAHALGAIGLIAFRVGPGLAARLGMWVATLGVLASLGVMSLSHMVPRLLTATRNEEIEVAPLQIAYGFGAFALEATILLILGPAMIAMSRIERPFNRILGVGILIGAAILVVFRLGMLL